LVFNKTLATLNGKKGVLACLTQNTYGDGRIHPSVNPFGTTTYRCSHGNPNINFPSVKVDEKTGQMVTGVSGKYGAEIRGLVEAPDGWVLMGADAAGLELRALGAVLLPTDGGAVLRDVLEGDIHETNANFYNLTLSKHGFTLVTRKSGKAVSYGIMYGSGTAKLAFVLGCSIDCAKEIILKLRKKWALDKFMAQCKQEIEEHHGHLLGLDGRYIYLRSPHASLNYKLQSTGSLLCKKAMNLFIHNMLKAGFVYGDDFQVVLFVHDEIQVLVREPIVEQAKLICRDSFYEGGRYYNIPFPLDSEIKIGKNWAETH
jgi:DNA polymerase I-like protein with 3'-5' exonuclease and polymerase domains